METERKILPEGPFYMLPGHSEPPQRAPGDRGHQASPPIEEETPCALLFLGLTPLQSPGCKRLLTNAVSMDTPKAGKAEESPTKTLRDLPRWAGRGRAALGARSVQ